MNPLETVRYELSQHTPRNPADCDVVLDAMASAIALHGEAGIDFATRLVNRLDPAGERPHTFGITPAETALRIGDVAIDPEADRKDAFGSLATIAVMNMVYNPSTSHHAGAVGSVGREALEQIRTSGTGSEFYDLVGSIVALPPVDPEDLAITLVDLPAMVEAKLRPALPENEGAEIPTASLEATEQPRSYMGEKTALPVQEITLNSDASRLRWLDKPLAELEELSAWPVIHDGAVIALLADLTPYHKKINSLMQDLEQHIIYQQFLTRLTATIIRHHLNPSSISRLSADAEKIPTYYSSNPGARNNNVTRAYFTNIGVTPDGTRILGLMAAARTKAGQAAIFNVIANHGLSSRSNA